MKSVNNKWVIIKGVCPEDLPMYSETATMFLTHVKFPIKVLVSGRFFSPKEWLRDAKSLGVRNSWQLAHFEWEFVNNDSFKYLL